MANLDRRTFLGWTLAASGGLIAGTGRGETSKDPLYRISLAEYSLHRTIAKGEVDPLDFASYTKREFDLDAVEHWNGPFKDKARDAGYMGEMRKRADDAGVRSLLIMIDGEGKIGDPDAEKRKQTVEDHYPWVEAAQRLGCHSIRVNAYSNGSPEEQRGLVADGLRRLSEFAEGHTINVIVENHGGLSSDGGWLAGVMKDVGMANCGTLPDFGNFGSYDRYLGVRELMPFAKAVSAKSRRFDEMGNEAETDYLRMMKIVVNAGYRGYVGIEYEGSPLSEVEGIAATKRLLERVREQLQAAALTEAVRPTAG